MSLGLQILPSTMRWTRAELRDSAAFLAVVGALGFIVAVSFETFDRSGQPLRLESHSIALLAGLLGSLFVADRFSGPPLETVGRSGLGLPVGGAAPFIGRLTASVLATVSIAAALWAGDSLSKSVLGNFSRPASTPGELSPLAFFARHHEDDLLGMVAFAWIVAASAGVVTQRRIIAFVIAVAGALLAPDLVTGDRGEGKIYLRPGVWQLRFALHSWILTVPGLLLAALGLCLVARPRGRVPRRALMRGGAWLLIVSLGAGLPATVRTAKLYGATQFSLTDAHWEWLYGDMPSPDGKRLAVHTESPDGGYGRIWIFDLEKGGPPVAATNPFLGFALDAFHGRRLAPWGWSKDSSVFFIQRGRHGDAASVECIDAATGRWLGPAELVDGFPRIAARPNIEFHEPAGDGPRYTISRSDGGASRRVAASWRPTYARSAPQFVFYIDPERRIHRIDLENDEDLIILEEGPDPNKTRLTPSSNGKWVGWHQGRGLARVLMVGMEEPIQLSSPPLVDSTSFLVGDVLPAMGSEIILRGQEGWTSVDGRTGDWKPVPDSDRWFFLRAVGDDKWLQYANDENNRICLELRDADGRLLRVVNGAEAIR